MDLATAQASYEAARAAYLKALSVKSAGALDQRIEYQDLKALRDEMEYWSRQVNDVSSGTSKPYSIARWTR